METDQKMTEMKKQGPCGNYCNYAQGCKGKHEYNEERNQEQKETQEPQSEMFKMKNALGGHESRFDFEEENISKLQSRVMDTVQNNNKAGAESRRCPEVTLRILVSTLGTLDTTGEF